jgi:NADH:ubiquinone oxidoreductase subunit E
LARLLADLPRQRTQLLPALLLVQRRLGHVPDWAVEAIAAHLRLTVNDVEGVTSGYPDLRRQPTGQHLVRVCTGLSCWAHGGDEVLAALEAAWQIKAGGTTADERFTLEEIACCFVCAAAPVVEVDGRFVGRVAAGAASALVSPSATP